MVIYTVLLSLILGLNLVLSADYNILGLYGKDENGHLTFAQQTGPWLSERAAANNFTYHDTQNLSDIVANNLKNYHVLMILDGIGLEKENELAVQNFVENQGGGLVVFHSANYNEKGWSFQWLHTDMLGAGPFEESTWYPQRITYHVDTPNHPALKGLPERFESSVSEWYSWENDIRKNPNIDILVSIDNSSFPVGTKADQTWYEGYYPVIFANRKHRVLYCNFGHNLLKGQNGANETTSSFSSDDQNKFLLQALRWLAGK